MDKKREDKALFEFKHALDDIVQLLRKSTEADTVYMYWVNRTREQFVLETNSTILPNVMFKDRINFKEYFLNGFKEIEQVMQLKVEDDVELEELTHYHDFVPVRFLTLVPFINNGETVALTVIETEFQINLSDYEDVLSSYRNALVNLLNTYLELTDLYDKQKEWLKYDIALDKITPKMHKAEILERMAIEMQKLVPNGGVTIVARGMDCWSSVYRTVHSPDHPALGLMVEEKSIAYDALQKGTDQFTIHFNQNPKRICSGEYKTEGATYAIPILMNDRRHAVILVSHHNPLVFKDSVKHKLKNFVRIAALNIQINQGRVEMDEDLLTSEYGSYIPELWERSLNVQIRRSGMTDERAWFGFAAINNLQEIRSRLRLEDLKRLQKSVVNIINPGQYGHKGIIGFNTDYVYSVLLTGSDPESDRKWKDAVRNQLKNPIELLNGQKVELSMTFGLIDVDVSLGDVYEHIKKAKKVLSDSMKDHQSRSASNF